MKDDFKYMQQIIYFFTQINSNNFISLFIKLFAILFAFIYLIFSIVILRQTQIMNKTVQTKSAGFLFFISFMQIIIAVILIFASLFLI